MEYQFPGSPVNVDLDVHSYKRRGNVNQLFGGAKGVRTTYLPDAIGTFSQLFLYLLGFEHLLRTFPGFNLKFPPPGFLHDMKGLVDMVFPALWPESRLDMSWVEPT
jgi:hypothetical protein